MDFIKGKIRNPNTPKLLASASLDFKTVVSESTGEVSTKKVADIHYCKVIIYESGTVMFMGSLHKMWNSINETKAPNYNPKKTYTGYNGNDFYLTEIIKTQSYLCKILLCTPEQVEFQNIEFGINTQISFDPQLFVKGLLYHNGKLFEYKYNDHFSQAVHQRYFLKIYNKSNQYGMDAYTLRFETKIIKSEDLKDLGIKTFADISAYTLDNAHKLLLQRLDEVVYYDYTVSIETFTERQTITLERYSNPRYWIYELSKENRYKNKTKLNKLIVKYSNNLKSQITASIIQKCNTINPKPKALKRSPINRNSQNLKKSPINRSSIVLISDLTTLQNQTPKQALKTSSKKTVFKRQIKTSNEPRFCKVTGLDISMQKAGSILLSHTGLKHHQTTNKIEFNRVLNKYLSRKWMDADFNTQIKELAHNIRNKHTGCKSRNDYSGNNLFMIAN